MRWLVLAMLASGCSDDCGPHGAPLSGLAVSNAQIALTYGALTAGPNNDCPPTPRTSVISLTIDGVQDGTTGQHITLCVPKPDQLQDHALAFGDDVKLFGIAGTDATCSYTLDTGQPPTGTLQAMHMCGNGTDKAGFAITVSATASVTRKCGTAIDTQAVMVSGTIAVAAMAM